MITTISYSKISFGIPKCLWGPFKSSKTTKKREGKCTRRKKNKRAKNREKSVKEREGRGKREGVAAKKRREG